ncbi:MAG TPA: SLC13 family permease, partial [Rhodospirillaceae bacterium]|nr:SLC13 family permease [Rhodospirillaceae bacterium]
LLLMPMAFGSLVGGLMTLIGTSPNIIVSRVRADLTGHPYAMFDYFPVGFGLSLCAVLFLSFAWRLLPREREPMAGAGAEDRLAVEDYLSEVRVEADSAILGSTVADLEQLFSEGSITVAAIIRDQEQRYIPGSHWKFLAGDILLIEGDPVMIKPLLEEAGLTLMASGSSPLQPGADLILAEAVVMPGSQLVGSTLLKSEIRARHGAAVLALRRAGRHFATRLQQMELRVGDVLVIEGAEDSLPGVLADLGCLALADRGQPRGRRQVLLPLVIAGLAMVVIAAGLVPVAIGFFSAAVLLVMFRTISLREAYEAINWPIIVMLAALIPVSDAMKSTGASELVAAWLVQGAAYLPPQIAVTMVMLGSMLLAPFLHHAPTVLVMGPIAAGMAVKLGLNIDPFLMAVAVGAGCDFLTPIGHQCNTLVMGPGGYRFGDYWRLGLPLSLIVLVVGTVLIELFWPLH